MTASQGSGAHRKGNATELRLSKVLSKWSGQRVLRTLSSGAGGARAESEIRMTGDLFFPIGSNNSFTYECKDHASSRVQHVINDNGDIPSFWQQATTDCRRLAEWGYSPMLIFHVSREADYVLVPWTRWLQRQLVDRKLPCTVQLTRYTEERTQLSYRFITILTTIPAITQLVPEELFDAYRGLNWDYLNEDLEVPEVDPVTVVDDVLDQIGDITED